MADAQPGLRVLHAYSASKFGLEGWMESLAPEVELFGITTTIVSPGSFRTELLTNESTAYATPSIDDYTDRGAQQREWWNARNGHQANDPAKLAQALLTLTGWSSRHAALSLATTRSL